jgi:hypothetical protein
MVGALSGWRSDRRTPGWLGHGRLCCGWRRTGRLGCGWRRAGRFGCGWRRAGRLGHRCRGRCRAGVCRGGPCADDRYRLADRHGRPLFDEQLFEDAVLVSFEIHVGLVCLDLGENVPFGDRFPGLLQPSGNGALFHGVREARHQDFGHSTS